MRKGRVAIINPNSTQAVTDGISRAVEGFRFSDGPAIDCLTLAEGPPGIETDQHVQDVIDPLCRLITDGVADAYVIACFGDPGLDQARTVTDKPVFGIAQSAYATAIQRGERFGIIAILEGSVPRHEAYVERLGLTSRFAASVPIGLGVVELEEAPDALARMEAVGKVLVGDRGADVLILGCAGMASKRQPLEEALGIPVIDPCQAAAAQAVAALVTAG
ncbi:MAG: aspartate/glutamate racemase family protein [Alphaproteobacteria bacterium]